MFMFLFSRKAKQTLLIFQPSRPMVGKSAEVMYFRYSYSHSALVFTRQARFEEDLNTAEEKTPQGSEGIQRSGGGRWWDELLGNINN